MAKYETCRPLVSTNSRALDVVEEVVNKLMLLPEGMIQEFADNDWHIFITRGSIESHLGEREPAPGEGVTMGITCMEDRVIFIPIFEENRTLAAGFATIHEFGHYYDRSNGLHSVSYKFQNIYNEEDRVFCKELCTATNTTNSVEYFAETFAAYVLNNEGLKKYCPNTYAYLETEVFGKYN